MKHALSPYCTFVALAWLMAGTAVAQTPAQAPAPPLDCAALITQVRDQVGNRFDNGRHTAVDLAAQAEQHHRDKKPAECLAKVQDAGMAAGLALK